LNILKFVVFLADKDFYTTVVLVEIILTVFFLSLLNACEAMNANQPENHEKTFGTLAFFKISNAMADSFDEQNYRIWQY